MEPSVVSLHRILLIDDNPDDRFLAIRELHQAYPQVEITQVSHAQEFVEVFEANCFDLVITDYQLRWTNGLQILQQVKARDRTIPVIMFTNTGSQEIAVEAMKAGLDDYVVKSPEHLIRLSQAVRTAWERTQTQQRAAELQLRLQSLLDRLNVGVFRLNQAGHLLEANVAFLRLLGTESLQSAQAYLQQTSQLNLNQTADETGAHEVQLQRSDGTSRWVLISEARHTVAGTEVIDGLLEDISARKAAEETIRSATQVLEQRVQERTAQLEATNHELGALIYSVSHDLRSPIRQISGFMQLLTQHLAHQNLSDPTRQYLKTLDDLTHQANHMIDDLLAYSQTGRAPMQPAWVDLGALVQEVKQRIEINLPNRAMDWQIHPLPPVWADLSLLRLVLQNLLDNAVKYTRPRSPAQIEIGSIEGDRSTVLFVRDNGVGFDMAYRDRLFDVFQRLHDDPQFEGTGIGLANVQRIVHRHGGQVWAEGRPGEGSTFYISLPNPSTSR